jgi:hypothetical protein
MSVSNLVMGCELLEGRQLFNAASPPTVNFEQYVKGSGTSRTFAVYYDGVDAIDKRTLDSNDIWVFGGNDFGARAVFVASAKTKRGNGLIARYRIDGILGGNYSIEMGEGEVRDIFGAMVNPGTIGAFSVGRKGRTVVVDPSRQLNPILEDGGTTNGPSFEPPEIDTSFGTVIGAFNFGGDAADMLGSGGVNVHFDSWHFGGLAAKRSVASGTTRSPFSVAITSPVANDLYDAVVGDQAVFESEVFTYSQSTITLEITGLDPTKKYQFQFLHGEARVTTFEYLSNPLFSLPTGQNVQTFLSFGQTPGLADSDSVVRVSGTTGLRCDMPLSPTRGPSYSGLVVAVADGGGGAPAAPTPKIARKSVRLNGPSHQFDLTFSGATAAGLASTNVLITGPGGYSARATMVGVLFNSDGSQTATYRIDGIEATGSYSISVDGVDVGRATLFYLVPVKWEAAPVAVARRHRGR